MTLPVRECARAAGLAYDLRPDWSAGGVEATLTPCHGADIIAFRGTTRNFRDILTDLRGLPWWDPYLGCWCHSGFLKGMRQIWPRMASYLAMSPREVFFTGHSKGGDEAILGAGFMLQLLGLEPAGIVTFGAARVGSAGLVKLLEHVPAVQYVHGDDCVPRHPWPIWGYRHIRPLTCFGSRGDRFLDHRFQNYANPVRPEILQAQQRTAE